MKLKKWLKKRCIHILIIVSIFIYLAIFQNELLDRLFISLKTLTLNIAYYFIDFYDKDAVPPEQTYDIILRINGGNLLFILPVDFDVFLDRISLSFRTLINRDVLNYYFIDCKNFLSIVTRIAILLIHVIGLAFLVVLATRHYKDCSKPVESKPLRAWFNVSKKIIDPLRQLIKGCWNFLFKSAFFKIMIILLLFFYSSLLIIAIDLLSTYFYLITSGDFNSIWQFIIIALIDFLPFFLALPLILKIAIIYAAIDVIRLFFGRVRLETNENKNESLIENETSNLTLVNGPSGCGKTDVLQDMIQTAEKILRNKKLLGIIHDVQNRFAFFPWAKLEDYTRQNKSLGLLKTRYDIYKLSYGIKDNYYNKKTLFGYDVERHGLHVYDQLINESLFSALCDYMTAFFFYITPTSLSVGNFAISHTLGLDLHKKSYFEIFHHDYFSSGKKDLENRSINKILNFDWLRLGEKMKKYSPANFYVPDIGVWGITEAGKELGSYDQKKSDQGLDSDEVNRSNSLFTERFLIWRHAAELRHVVLFKSFMDEQQLMALNPGMRKASETIITLDRSKRKHKRALKLWFIESMICEFIIKKYNKYHDKTKSIRRDITLRSYIASYFIQKVYLYYIRRCNRFDYIVFEFTSVNGSLEDVSQKQASGKWFLSIKKAHSGRYTSTYLSTLFIDQMKQSRISFEDLTSYRNIKPSINELTSQNAIFYRDITANFDSPHKKRKDDVKKSPKKGVKEDENNA